MRGVVNKFVCAGHKESRAIRRVDVLVSAIGEYPTVRLFTAYDAVYNYDTECVDIYHTVSGELVNSICEYEDDLLKHYTHSVDILFSLVFYSMMSVSQILGIQYS